MKIMKEMYAKSTELLKMGKGHRKRRRSTNEAEEVVKEFGARLQEKKHFEKFVCFLESMI